MQNNTCCGQLLFDIIFYGALKGVGRLFVDRCRYSFYRALTGK